MKEQDVLNFIMDSLIEVNIEDITSLPEIEPDHRETFEELLNDFKQTLYMTKSIEDTLAVMLAVNFSTYVKGGNPLWLYVVGPPSSGKSTLAECLAVDKLHCKSISKFTGLHSGWKDKSGGDNSLLNQVQDKTLLIKDFTTVLTAPATIQENVYGELRDAYDGTAATHYRNSISKEYTDINFTLICCVTDEVHNQNKSSLGERFLKVEILDEAYDDNQLITKGIDNAISAIIGSITQDIKKNNISHLQAATFGFMLHKINQIEGFTPPEIPAWFKAKIKALAKLIANLRATVSREMKGGLSYRPRSELGLRLASQLVKLAIMLCYVKDKTAIDLDVYKIVKRVALDTAKGFNYEIIQLLAGEKYGLTNLQISSSIQLSVSSVKRKLTDLQELGVVYRKNVSNGSGMSGRKSHQWHLSDEVKEIWSEAFNAKKTTANRQTKKKVQKRKTVKRQKTTTRKKRTSKKT